MRAVLANAHTGRHSHARVRCASALQRDGRRASNCFAHANFTSAAESASACCCTAFAPQRVRSKVESLRALHQYANVQRELALHAAPATRVARPAPVGPLPSWSHCGRFVVHERRHCVRLRCAAFATRRATVESLRRFTCRCNGTRAETIAASRPAVVRCAATVEAQVRGPPVPLSDRFVQSTQIAAWHLQT